MEWARKFADMILQGNVTEVHAANYYITTEGVQSIADALKKNTSVTYLNLASNLMGGNGLLVLSEMLKTNTTLNTLNLSGNRMSLLDGTVECLLDALSVNTSLTTLHLHDTYIHSSIISTALMTNITLINVTGVQSNLLKSLLKRNRIIRSKVRSIVLFIIKIRGEGAFQRFPKEMMRMIAQKVWATRGDCIWLRII